MIFIYCNWVSHRWQRSVDLYKNRKETVIYKRRNNTQNRNTEYTKQKIKKQNKITNIQRILKDVSQGIGK